MKPRKLKAYQFGETNGMCKYSDELVNTIKTLLLRGRLSNKEIADSLNVPQRYVSEVKHGKIRTNGSRIVVANYEESKKDVYTRNKLK